MESDPVQLFCAANGLESREDFAFLFETREEAHAEGGPIIAAAWEVARPECSEGLAVKVRDIYAMQAASAKPSMPAPPSASSAAKPTSAPRVARRKHKSDLDLVARNAEFRTVLVDIVVAGSKYSSQLWSDAATGVVRTIVGKPLASAEPSTLARVCSTWRELKQYCAGHGYVIHSLTALQVASFVAASQARSRVLPALTFMCKHLHFAADLELARSLSAPKGSSIGHGARQAPVAQPVMLLRLEESLVSAIRAKNPNWTALYATWLQATGCVRLTHVQRSRLIRMDGYTMYFECTRGKQRSLRAGFLWSAPRFGIAEDTDFGAAFVGAIEALPAKSSPCSVAFELGTGAELGPATIRSIVQLAMASLMYSGEVRKVSSKSWRELPVTLGFLAGLGATDVCAIGNWLDSASQGCNVMPWRYHRAKQLQATTLKHRLRFVIKDIVLDQAWHTWEEVDQGVLQQSMERSVDAAAAIMAFQTPTVYQFRGQHNLLREQALRARSQIAALVFRRAKQRVRKPISELPGRKRKRTAAVAPQRVLSRKPSSAPDLDLPSPSAAPVLPLAGLGGGVPSTPASPSAAPSSAPVLIVEDPPLAPPQPKAKAKAMPKPAAAKKPPLIPLPPPGPPPQHIAQRQTRSSLTALGCSGGSALGTGTSQSHPP